MTTAPPEDPVEDFLPLRPVEFLVLAVLNERDLHGYGIVQEIEERTDGKVSIAPGNLYRVLDRLLQRGLLADSDRRPVAADGPRRRYYAITDLGREVAVAEAEMFGKIARGVREAAEKAGV